MLLLLDNRDSFTFNLVQAFQALGASVVVRRSHEIGLEEVRRLAPERIVIGPGPGGPPDAGCSLAVARELAGEVPLLGVCLGLQVIGAAFGARIGPARELVHGRAVPVEHDGRGLFEGLPSPLRATRYNSLAVLEEGWPEGLEVSARSPDGDVMGLRVPGLAVEAVQFHPESILSRGCDRLLAAFLRLVPARAPGSTAARDPRAGGAARRPPGAAAAG